MFPGRSTPPTTLSRQEPCLSWKPPLSAGGYAHVPGIFTDEHIKGWKKVTDAVHAKGWYIFLQLWALGRAADIDFLEKQDPPSPYVSASSVSWKVEATSSVDRIRDSRLYCRFSCFNICRYL
ncbi:hypothetical protein EV363DRAFT_1435121 [Boletus edulis]|nr:hypothetical protein EV363DRAFT_1435121 [Boletus edulis]